MNARVWLVAGAIPCAALALVLLGRPEPAGVSPQTHDLSGPMPVSAVADAEPAVLASREAEDTPPAVLAEVPSAPVSSARPPEHSSPLPGQARPGPMTQLILDGQREPPPPLAANERAFEAETIDSEWAPMAEARILDAFAQQTGLQLLDLRVDCRTTMCRVQMTQPRGSATGVQPSAFLSKVGYPIRFIVALDDQAGGRGSIAYLIRPGTPPAGMPSHSTDPRQPP